jgi:ACS family D-galactonate transporter-like MFS transporter
MMLLEIEPNSEMSGKDRMTGGMRSRLKVRHVVLAVLCLLYFVAYIDRVNISVTGPMIRRELRLTPTELGLIFSAFAYPYATMQIVGGWSSDKFGPRLVLASLSLLWCVATIMTGLSWSVASLITARVLVGVGEGGVFPTATRALTFWMPVGERAFSQGIMHSFARLGGALTTPIVLALVAWSGWRDSFIALGLASALCTVAWLIAFRNSPAEHPWMTTTELHELSGHGTPRPGVAARTPWVEIASRMWLVTLVDFCYGWCLWVFLTWVPSYLLDARGFKLNVMALWTMLPLMAGVVGDTLGGVVSDRLFRRTGNLRFARRAPLIVGLFGALIFIVPAVMTDSPQGAVYGLSLGFFFLELTNAVLWALPIDIAGSHAGTASGMMNSGFGIAGMISPVVFGIIIERTGRYDLPFFLSAGLLFVGGICSMFVDPTDKVQGRAEWPSAAQEGTYAC